MTLTESINNNQLLAVRHNNYDCFYTIGGRINLNETYEVVFFYLMKSTDVQFKNEACTDQQEEKL